MKCLDDCHTYELDLFKHGEPGALLEFYRLNPDGSWIDGVINEEVITVLIHRLEKLNEKFFCPENSFAIDNLRGALMWLERRTADRKVRGVEGQHKA